MHHAKNRGNKEIPLAILPRILPQSCVTICLNICREGLRLIVLVSLIVLLKGFPCFHDFLHGASHPYIHIECGACIFCFFYTEYSYNSIHVTVIIVFFC